MTRLVWSLETNSQLFVRCLACLEPLVVVLEDIIKTMHNEKFMAELFKPHHMYSNISTRQIFDRLAHSSIMRLNTNSMDKVRDCLRVVVFVFVLENGWGCARKLMCVSM